MNTLDKQKEIIEILVNKINEHTNDKVEVININDYTEERKDHMISVGISNMTPFHEENPMLPDYNITVDILVDSFIDKDRYGHQFEQNKNELLNYLEPYFQNPGRLDEIFEDIPVCAFFLQNIDNSTTEESNICRITIQLVASFPI